MNRLAISRLVPTKLREVVPSDEETAAEDTIATAIRSHLRHAASIYAA